MPPNEDLPSFYTYLDRLAHDPAMLEDVIVRSPRTRVWQEASLEAIEAYQDFLFSAFDQYRGSLKQSQKGTRS